MHLRTSLVLVSLGSLVVAATACDVGTPDLPVPSSTDTGEETVSASADAIKGGYSDSADTATVGIVLLDGNEIGSCSGSLIAPNMVLTARHCVSDTLNEVMGGVDCSKTKSGVPKSTNAFYVTTKQSMTQNPNDYHTVQEVLIVPAENSLFCGNDQAILILSENIDPSEAVPLVPRVDSTLAKGEQYYAIGYGATNDAGAGAGQRRRRDNLFVSCAETECKGSYIRDTEWVGDQGICSGDSGGPALDLQNRVVGVTSRGGAGCLDPVYGGLYGWGQWIKDSAIHAAELGGYPPAPWTSGFPTDPEFNLPIGGACDDTCASGVCLDDQCTRLCSEEAYCPEGYQCSPINETQSACELIPEPPEEKKPVVTETTCAASVVALGSDKDPTNPVPWFGAAAIVLGVGAVARRRASKGARKS